MEAMTIIWTHGGTRMPMAEAAETMQTDRLAVAADHRGTRSGRWQRRRPRPNRQPEREVRRRYDDAEPPRTWPTSTGPVDERRSMPRSRSGCRPGRTAARRAGRMSRRRCTFAGRYDGRQSARRRAPRRAGGPTAMAMGTEASSSTTRATRRTAITTLPFPAVRQARRVVPGGLQGARARYQTIRRPPRDGQEDPVHRDVQAEAVDDPGQRTTSTRSTSARGPKTATVPSTARSRNHRPRRKVARRPG